METIFACMRIFGPGYGKFMKRRVESPMTIQMTSLARVACGRKKLREKNLRFDAFCLLRHEVNEAFKVKHKLTVFDGYNKGC